MMENITSASILLVANHGGLLKLDVLGASSCSMSLDMSTFFHLIVVIGIIVSWSHPF